MVSLLHCPSSHRVPTINVRRRSSLFSTPVIETDGPISGWCHNYRFTCLDYPVEARNPRRPIKCHNMAPGHTREFFFPLPSSCNRGIQTFVDLVLGNFFFYLLCSIFIGLLLPWGEDRFFSIEMSLDSRKEVKLINEKNRGFVIG